MKKNTFSSLSQNSLRGSTPLKVGRLFWLLGHCLILVSSDDAIALLPHLFQFTDEHKDEGLSLQDDLIEFGAELQSSVVEIWRKQEPEGQNGSTDGWAARMLELEKRRQIDPLDKVVQPDISKREWDPKLSRVVL